MTSRRKLAGCALAVLTALFGRVMPVHAQGAGGASGQAKPVDPPALEWKLAARLMVDSAVYGGSVNPLSNGAKIRRAALALNLKFDRWTTNIDVDFTDEAVTMRDTFVAYAVRPRTQVRAGNFKEPIGLDSLTSSRFTSFMERGLIDSFTAGRRLGVAVAHWSERWQASAGFFGPTTAGALDRSGDDQAASVAGRITVLPFARGDSLVHLGLSAGRRTPDAAMSADRRDANQMRLSSLPETRVSQARFIDTGVLTEVRDRRLVGLEAAWVAGPFSAQAEYGRVSVHRRVATLPDAAFDTWYAYASWFPTGEQRPYEKSTATFSRVTPPHRHGALELLARVSAMDLNDPSSGILGGRERIVTLGATWYANVHVRLMANYLNVWNDAYARGNRDHVPGDSFHVFQTRLQFSF